MAVSIIFPAFVNEYKGTENQTLNIYKNTFRTSLKYASGMLGIDLDSFDFVENNFLHDELRSQYISYIFSCSVADILKHKGVHPSCVSGYSMGIYSALYYCESISFDDGLLLIKNAWDTISEVATGRSYGMGMIIGLNESDVSTLLQNENGAEICNQNNLHTYIISGYKDSVERVLSAAKAEGAMRTSILPVSKPYHSHHLKKTEITFADEIQNINFRHPLYSYISSLDQRMIRTGDDFKNEVILNLSARMNWYETMKFHIFHGSKTVFECGAGDGLTRNARFIEGDYEALSISKLGKLLR